MYEVASRVSDPACAMLAQLLAQMLAATECPWSPTSNVVATFSKNCKWLTTSSHSAAQAALSQLARQPGDGQGMTRVNCGPFCEPFSPYMSDRCWSPRARCALTITGADWTLTTSSPRAHATKYTAGTPFVAGKYVVILGAASALGTATTTQMDQMLEDAGISVINLGRGAAGPRFPYLESWDAIEKIVVNAAAVVINAMALRSTPNDACGEDCKYDQRWNVWMAAMQSGNLDAATAMEESSLANALADYTELLRRISESPCKLGSTPKKILLWLSRCDTAIGCTDNTFFPQWFTSKPRIDQLFGLSGWDHVVDANYADKPKVLRPSLFHLPSPHTLPTPVPHRCDRRRLCRLISATTLLAPRRRTCHTASDDPRARLSVRSVTHAPRRDGRKHSGQPTPTAAPKTALSSRTRTTQTSTATTGRLSCSCPSSCNTSTLRHCRRRQQQGLHHPRVRRQHRPPHQPDVRSFAPPTPRGGIESATGSIA